MQGAPPNDETSFEDRVKPVGCSRRVIENDYGAVVAHCGTNCPIPSKAQETIFDKLMPELWEEIVQYNQ